MSLSFLLVTKITILLSIYFLGVWVFVYMHWKTQDIKKDWQLDNKKSSPYHVAFGLFTCHLLNLNQEIITAKTVLKSL
jgi:hypothetical protein